MTSKYLSDTQTRRYRFLGLIFALSGFSGLIYETVWARFLKLFLGHAANAQAAVLAIFMGGMALGAWAGARYSPRFRNLLKAYAVVEGVIGLGALLFPPAFDSAVAWSFSTVIPALGSPLAATAYKWLLACALLLPQSILLGATFHLMAAGLIRNWPETPGRTIATLYFLNSLGAAVGALVAGFWLVGWVGLIGTVRLAGVINLALALAVFLLASKTAPADSGGTETAADDRAVDFRFRAFLAAAMLTGTASFLYEVGWIRMLCLVLGSSTHAFELMLSAFILGLALGAAWISGRIDRLPSPDRFLGYVQIGMGLFALATLPVYGLTFNLMKAGIRKLPATVPGYFLFNLMSHALALLVMLPATFCAGMVLPLVTGSLLRTGYGERSIGQVYTWNTIGAVAGVFLGVHVGFPYLGLKGIIGGGAILDISVGLGLLWALRPAGEPRWKLPALTAAALLLPAAALLLFGIDARKMASAVYRTGELISAADGKILFQADGKTATVTVTEDNTGTITLRTNGKPDAAVMRGQAHSLDESTMTLLGILPTALNPGARSAANIGLGAGTTTHGLLLSPYLREVDTIEIEPEVLRAARLLERPACKTFTDPRSHIHIDDARNFFSSGNRRYDLIVSEPSNPWVSGVSDLFTVEFYRQVRHHLTPDGIFTQWLHLYELDVDLIVSVLKPIEMNFDDYVVYATNDFDILIAARNGTPVPAPDPGYLRIPEVAEALKGVSIRSPQDLAIRKIGNRKTLAGLLHRSGVIPNSDYRPILDEGSARARFLRTRIWEFGGYSYAPLPAYQFLSGEFRNFGRTDITPAYEFQGSLYASRAGILRDAYLSGRPDSRFAELPEQLSRDTVTVGRMFFGPGDPGSEAQRFEALYNVGSLLTSFLDSGELATVWAKLESGPGADKLTARERDWIAVLKSIGRRDGKEMARLAQLWLMRHAGTDQLADQYLVLAGSLGATASGDEGTRRGMATLLWDDKVVRDPEARFLRSLIGP